MKPWVFMIAGLALGAVTVAEEVDIWSKTINNEYNGTWNITPDKPKPRQLSGQPVPGERAFRIKATKGANPWDVQASSPIGGAIDAGDVIMLMYYARAEQPADGGSSLTARVQLGSPPWTSIMEMSSPITSEWKSYCAHRVASAAIGGKQGSVSIHLATAVQVIDLGPVFVFNFGPGYDQKKLKGCDG